MTDKYKDYIREQVYLALQQAAQKCNQSVDVDRADIKLVELGLYSLKLIEVVFDLEQQFDVHADESAMAALQTVDDVVRMIESSVRQSQMACS